MFYILFYIHLNNIIQFLDLIYIVSIQRLGENGMKHSVMELH